MCPAQHAAAAADDREKPTLTASTVNSNHVLASPAFVNSATEWEDAAGERKPDLPGARTQFRHTHARSFLHGVDTGVVWRWWLNVREHEAPSP